MNNNTKYTWTTAKPKTHSIIKQRKPIVPVVIKEPSLIKTIIELLKTGVDIVKLGFALSKDMLELTIFAGRLIIDEVHAAVKSIKSLSSGDINKFIGLVMDIAGGEKSGTNSFNLKRKNLNEMLSDLADMNI